MAKIPSRDAFPSDISNIHVSILERCGKLKLKYFNGSITAFPIIETIANDITEYTAIILFIYFYSFYILYSLFYCLLSILPYHYEHYIIV